MFDKRIGVGAIGLTVLLCGVGVAYGDEPDATPIPGPLPESNVPIEEIVIQGLRTKRITAPPSAFSTQIDTDDYQGERRSVADMIAEQVGVQVRRFGGPGEPAEVSIRGSTGSQVVVTLDGVRINSALTGGTDISQLCLGLLGSAEITRGGDSLRSGEGAIGGTVAFRTRRPRARPESRVQVTGGAFGTWEANLNRSARAGPLDYQVGYCGFTTDGDYSFARPDIQVQTRPSNRRPPLTRINNQRVRHSANVSLGREIGSLGYLRISDYITYSSHGEPGLDSGDDPLGGQNPFAQSRELHNLAQLEWTAEDLGLYGDALEASLYHRYQRLQFEDPGVSPNDEPISSLTEVNTFGLDLADTWSFDLFAGDHDLDLRVNTRRDALYADDRSNQGRTTFGVAVAEEASWLSERIRIVSGVRLEWVQGIGETWLPALGIVLTPLPWLRLQGNLQRSYRAPSFDELFLPDKGFIRGNPDLLPEAARNADVGLVLTLEQLGPFSDLRFEGGVFQQDIDQSIIWVPVSPRTVEPNNTGPARVRGFELALQFNLSRFVRIKANHTSLESENSTTGKPLAGRADQETHIRVEIGERGRWKWVGEMQRTGEIPVSPSGAIRLPSRVIWSASAAVNLAAITRLSLPEKLRELWLYATLTNIGDVAVRDGLFFPQPGRSGYLGTEIEW